MTEKIHSVSTDEMLRDAEFQYEIAKANQHAACLDYYYAQENLKQAEQKLEAIRKTQFEKRFPEQDGRGQKLC